MQLLCYANQAVGIVSYSVNVPENHCNQNNKHKTSNLSDHIQVILKIFQVLFGKKIHLHNTLRSPSEMPCSAISLLTNNPGHAAWSGIYQLWPFMDNNNDQDDLYDKLIDATVLEATALIILYAKPSFNKTPYHTSSLWFGLGT